VSDPVTRVPCNLVQEFSVGILDGETRRSAQPLKQPFVDDARLFCFRRVVYLELEARRTRIEDNKSGHHGSYLRNGELLALRIGHE
jgi:hypothetical protein